MIDSHVDCGGPCETPRTDPSPQPAEAALAEALCYEVPHSKALHPVIDEDRARRLLTRLTTAGWSLTRDHARCDGLREALRRLIDAIETTGLHEHDDGRGGVNLCIPISGIRGVMNDACEAAGHEFLHPEFVPPFCRWCGAALAPSPATEAERRG